MKQTTWPEVPPINQKNYYTCVNPYQQSPMAPLTIPDSQRLHEA